MVTIPLLIEDYTVKKVVSIAILFKQKKATSLNQLDLTKSPLSLSL